MRHDTAQREACSKRLGAFYREHGISVDGFKLQALRGMWPCSREWLRCAGDPEAHVGSNYGQSRRVVVAALRNPAERTTVLACRFARVEKSTLDNQHMRGTLQLLRAVYGVEAFAGNEENHLDHAVRHD